MEAALLDTEDTGNVTVGTVTLTGQSTGAAGVGLTVQALGNESGSSYVAEDVSGASLSVVQLPTVPGGEDTPGDVDDDGVYEDVNGDGEVTVADVQALWDSRDDPSITANPEFYDFNDDGVFDVVDVQALFDLVVN
jgi:PKD repeat protein